MKLFSILLMLTFAITGVIGQEVSINNKSLNLEILKADSLITGIYMTFKEFQENNPSIQKDIKFGNRKVPSNYMPTPLKKVYLYVVDTNNIYTQFKQIPWGVCKKNQVFILFGELYLKVTLNGKFCSFTSFSGNSFMSSISNLHGNSTSVYNSIDYILNITNNSKWIVTIDNVKQMLKKENINLFNEFNLEKDKHSLSYIDKVNKLYTYK